jgi:O-antigen ligase
MYISSDVGSRGAYRIPATFNQAAGYGGVMVLTVPLLLGRWSGQGAGFAERVLLAAGLGAAVLGVFLCGSRAPVLVLFLLAAYFTLTLRARFRAVVLVGLVVAAALYVVSGNERLQRFTTLEDPELIVSRVGGSVNVGVVDLLLEYPMGSGLGSAVGTSVPAFLKTLAQQQIGAENEYVRIGLEQGLTGVVLWAAFLVWLFTRSPASWKGEWGMGLRLARVYVFLAWGAAALSTGFLTAIPATALVLFLMGVLGREQFPARAPDVRVGSARFHGASQVATAAPRAAH